MRFKGVKVGFALTGSHCCLDPVLPQIANLVKEGAKVYPIVSNTVDITDTRYGTNEKWKGMLKEITGRQVLATIVDVEIAGPQKMFDVVVVAPCTGNTLAKLANGITDGSVLMAVKAQLRNQRPVVLAVSTNDGLGMNAKNIGLLLNVKNVYMTPFGQDNPVQKPNSLISKWELIPDTIHEALKGKQYQPILVFHQ